MFQVLASLDGFPLFEIHAGKYITHLFDPASLEQFRCERPVVAVDRWLRRRGIDLIFVPIPKMTEVYIEHFVDPCPPDGIIAPRVRQAHLEMLEADVEVVDGWRLFRPVREPDPEYLYNPGRYVFRDLAGAVGGFGRGLLSTEQYDVAQPAQTTTLSDVRMQDGEPPPDDPNSPVLVMGHSFVPKFREQLIKELNMLTHTRAFDHQTTESFADFLREPELLAHCRVLVWITTTQHMTWFQPLPPQVMEAQPQD
jgi:hypothetical protein